MLDVGARQGGHAPDDSRGHADARASARWPARRRTRPVAAVLADALGRPPRWFEFAVRLAGLPRGRRRGRRWRDRRDGVATINGPVGWIGTIWVAPAHRGATGSASALTAVDHRRGRGRRLPDARPRGDGRGSAALRAPRVSRSRPGTGPWRRRACRPTARPPTRGSVPSAPADLDAMTALDGPPPARTAAHVIAAFATPRRPGSSMATDGPAGFVDPGAVGRRRDGRAERRRRADRSCTRGACASRARQARPLRDPRSRTSVGAAAARGDRLDRGVAGAAPDPRCRRSTGDPSTIWGQFNHAMG